MLHAKSSFDDFAALEHSTSGGSPASFHYGTILRTLEHDTRLGLSHLASSLPCIYLFLLLAYHNFSFHQLYCPTHRSTTLGWPNCYVSPVSITRASVPLVMSTVVFTECWPSAASKGPAISGPESLIFVSGLGDNVIDNWPEGGFRGENFVTNLVQRTELGMGCSNHWGSEETTACTVLSLLPKEPTEELNHVAIRRVIVLLSSRPPTGSTKTRF